MPLQLKVNPMKKLFMALLLPFVMLFSFPTLAAIDGASSFDKVTDSITVQSDAEVFEATGVPKTPDKSMSISLDNVLMTADEDSETLPLAASLQSRIALSIQSKDRIPIIDH